MPLPVGLVNRDENHELCFFSKQTALMLLLEKNSLFAEEITIFLAVKKWIEVNKPDEPTSYKILCLIRLPLMSTEVC